MEKLNKTKTSRCVDNCYKIMKIKKGTTRFVILLYRYAIKIPNFINGQYLFLQGCVGNCSERRYCKMMKNVDDNAFYDLVAPSLYCSFFGLIQIQKRCAVCKKNLTTSQLDIFKDISSECKPNNYGYINGKLVCLDYA